MWDTRYKLTLNEVSLENFRYPAYHSLNGSTSYCSICALIFYLNQPVSVLLLLEMRFLIFIENGVYNQP
jgi:hypothetical protein